MSVGVGIGPSGSKSTGADAVSPSCKSKAMAEHTWTALAQSSTVGGKVAKSNTPRRAANVVVKAPDPSAVVMPPNPPGHPPEETSDVGH